MRNRWGSLVRSLGIFWFSKKPITKKEILEGDRVGFKSKKQAFLGSSLEKIFVEYVHRNLKLEPCINSWPQWKDSLEKLFMMVAIEIARRN